MAERQSATDRAATLPEVVGLSRIAPALALLDSAALARIAGLARVHSVSAGTCIVKHGEAGRSLYFVLEGRTMAVTLVAAAPHVLEMHEPGAFFGEIAAVTRVPRQIDVVAVQPTTLLELPQAALSELLDHAAARAVLIKQLLERCERLRLARSG